MKSVVHCWVFSVLLYVAAIVLPVYFASPDADGDLCGPATLVVVLLCIIHGLSLTDVVEGTEAFKKLYPKKEGSKP